MTVQAATKIDARPVRPISDGTPWATAVARRDAIEKSIRTQLDREKIDAAVFLSAIGNYPPWVKLEAWLPTDGRTPTPDGARERAELEISVTAKPYHEHETVVAAKAVRGKKHIAIGERPEFTEQDAAEWVRFAVGRGAKPSNYRPGTDFFMHLLGALIPFLPKPHRNRLDRRYRSGWFGIGLLGVISAIALFGGLQLIAGQGDQGQNGAGAGLLMILLGGVGALATVLVTRKRQHHISVLPQPVEMPRALVLVDSWHSVVSDIGGDFDAVRARLANAVANGGEAFGLTCRSETYTHTRPNGYEQRDRLVVSKDQGMVHIHIYAFGKDVFVGWQAYLNWLKWGESKAISSRVSDGNVVEYRDVSPDLYVPNQFDLMDLSSLSEYVHRRLEQEIRAILKEKKIDQDIDFKIIRGDRDRALDEEQHGRAGKRSGSRFSYKPS